MVIMAGNESPQIISLKLLVDKSSNKVLFAEAGKEFVDFIFHTMSLPVGTVVQLLSQQSMVGCLGELYKSVESLSTQFFQSDLNKDLVLNPKAAVDVPLLALNNSEASSNANSRTNTFYICGACCNEDHFPDHVTDLRGTKCPICCQEMNLKINYVGPTVAVSATPASGGESGGYVKGVVTYMVMDNLVVKPMSTISGITLMNKFHVKDVSILEEKEVQIGLKEGLAILKAAMETKAVLSLMFLGNKI